MVHILPAPTYGDADQMSPIRAADPLVTSGLVTRTEGTADRRHVALTLTLRGQTLVERLMEQRERELTTIVSRMTNQDRDRLMSALTPFNRAASDDLWPSDRAPDARDPRLLEWGL